MTPRCNNIRLRTLQTTGALLAGLVLAGCGTQSITAGVPAPPMQNPPAPAEPRPLSAVSEHAAGSDPASTATQSASGGARTQPATPQPATERCHTSMLSGSLLSSGQGAGQRYADLTLRNDSEQTCTLYGYGGLQLIGSDGQPLPTTLERTTNPGPAMTRLAPGETASATLRWSVVSHGDEPIDRPCQPEPATARVTPPDETDPLTITWDNGVVCGAGSIDGSAYHQ